MEAAVLRCDGELAMRKGDNERAEECFIRSKDWPLLEMLYLTSGQHDKLAAIINGINFSALNELAIGDASERTMALEQAGRPVLAYLNAVAYMSCGVNPDAVRLLTQLSAAAGAPRPYRQLNKDDDLAPNVLEAWHAAVAAASAEGLRAAKAQGSAAWRASGFGGGGETGPATQRADDDTAIIDDDEDDKPKEMDENLLKLKAAAEARLAKKEAAQKSMVVIEVKPWEADQDLNALWKKIVTEMTFEGLKWGEACQLVDVAFGIKKIVMSCVIKMDVSMDDVTEAIQGLEDEVQSVDIVSMNVL